MLNSKDLFQFDGDPIENFNRLYAEAQKHPGLDPTVMTLSTLSAQGSPNARVVLLKQVEGGDFVFFTNYNSTKAQELGSIPKASLVFFWGPMAVQIRVSGAVKRTTRLESEAYFKSRPRLSQLGAWASHQSEIIESYETLEGRLAKVTAEFEGKDVPCPQHWGGFRVAPENIEFWFGMEGRLHYRYVYERSGQHWLRTMKSP